ncbi:MAG: response regulator [Chloroflexi bacterium]|nr:response regulator [Chloroflexota bacterium]MBU1750979.1 response regulator [Chloroflexota bacterium]
MELYLTPAAIGYLAQLILALLITGYLAYHAAAHRRRGASTLLLIGVFAAVVGVVLLFFLDAALPPSQRLYAVYLENTVIGLLLTLLTQFAYRFPRLYPQRKWEARIVLAVDLGYTLWEAGLALQRGGLLLQDHHVLYRPGLPDYALVACFAWVPLAFLRQTLAASQEATGRGRLLGLYYLWRPQGPAAQAARAFALIFLIPLALSLLNIGRATFYISPAVFQSSMSAGILLTQFLFALVYLNAIPEMTSFQVRLVGITLVMVLAVFGAAGWAMTPPHAAVYRPALVDHQTLRFTPNANGGYDVAPAGFHFDADLGSPLDFQLLRPDSAPWEAVADVAFAFPFYGQTAQTLWVMRSGAVGVGAPVRYPSMEYYYAATPAIFPLFVTLTPSPSGGVFAKNEGERLTITWYQLPTIYDLPGSFTFQAVLHRDGVFEITTNGLSDLPYQPDASPFVNVWLMGALPGIPAQPPQLVNFVQAPLQGGPQGLVQDHYLEFRRHLHQLLWPLAALILASSLFVVVGLPLAWYVSLVRPLNALLAGVRRVQAGDLDTTMPAQTHDELGFLTQAFNDMVAQLRELVAGLETRVAERTQALHRANEQLRHEAFEREKAQAALLDQQRHLARLEERERLGRDLHDGLGQTLGYINVQAQATHTLLAQGHAAAAQTGLTQMAQAAQSALTEVRGHILGLRAGTAPADFYATLQEALDQFSQRCGVHAALSLPDDAPRPAFAPAVEEQVVRIVLEALTNIRKHARASQVQVLLSFANGQAQIVIADDGVGFTPTPAPLRARETGEGEGRGHLGLSIMRERAQQAGGRLEIRSAPGQGTRVLAFIPRLVAAGPPGAEAEMPAWRVLLADDSPLFVDGLRNLLTARGLTVVSVARDGREAIEKARALRPDVVVMDIAMPRCDGLEATRAIKAELPATRIVMLTVSEAEEHLFEAVKSGASGYLLKSLEANEFCALLAGLMRGEAAFSPGLAARVLAELAHVAPTPAPLRAREPGEGALTPRQWEILQMVAQGRTYKEIGAALHLTEKTIKYHMGQILERLHLENRAQAIAYAQRMGKTD